MPKFRRKPILNGSFGSLTATQPTTELGNSPARSTFPLSRPASVGCTFTDSTARYMEIVSVPSDRMTTNTGTVIPKVTRACVSICEPAGTSEVAPGWSTGEFKNFRCIPASRRGKHLAATCYGSLAAQSRSRYCGFSVPVPEY